MEDESRRDKLFYKEVKMRDMKDLLINTQDIEDSFLRFYEELYMKEVSEEGKEVKIESRLTKISLPHLSVTWTTELNQEFQQEEINEAIKRREGG
ncbi:hypothetical protein NDU88_006314 [Pleurodeles waltl]|uniref:Uncharacterized protein n=1 Tax=Pleurodeles waltl TaxID=8319 RepID=A0AAV7TDJ8_PLEWA|nr:hypothetical protein NDU88_006314 [Pleurodeles waltl]